MLMLSGCWYSCCIVLGGCVRWSLCSYGRLVVVVTVVALYVVRARVVAVCLVLAHAVRGLWC